MNAEAQEILQLLDERRMIEAFKKVFMYLALREQEEMENKLGFISDKYESGEGKVNAGTIGNLRGDPGGKSYGVYQLSLNKGTLKRYIALSKYAARFKDIPLGTKEFDIAWLSLADDDEVGFAEDQFSYIRRSHYLPAIEYARNQGFDISNRAVQEAVFSISVQHGGFKRVIALARHHKRGKAVVDQVNALYDARQEYVTGLSGLSADLKKVLLNRYVRELNDVLELV